MDGMMSADEFKSSCLHLIDAWATHCSYMPSWRWNEANSHSFRSLGFLSLDDVPFDRPKSMGEEECVICDVPQVDENDQETVLPSDLETYFFTYHIIYNEIFRVPKLFLRGRYSDGKPLPWEVVQNILPAGSYQESAKWAFLTYEDHPYLNRPWLALHPCGTSKLMSIVFSTPISKSLVGNYSEFNDGNSEEHLNDSEGGVSTLSKRSNMYMLTWLSFVSQAIALKLPMGFSKCLSKYEYWK